MFVLVNLKAYDCDAVALARDVRAVAESSGVRVAVAPPAVDLAAAAETGAEVWAQHVDGVGHGSHTGHVTAADAEAAGATGTLLNHSERRLRLADVEAARGRATAAGLETVICGNTPGQVAAAAALGPAAVAVEPPELIGTGTPVSRADPDVVRDAVAAVDRVAPDVDVLCGAGISTGEDVVAARELGAAGVLLASGVAKAEDPRGALEGLVEPLR